MSSAFWDSFKMGQAAVDGLRTRWNESEIEDDEDDLEGLITEPTPAEKAQQQKDAGTYEKALASGAITQEQYDQYKSAGPVQSIGVTYDVSEEPGVMSKVFGDGKRKSNRVKVEGDYGSKEYEDNLTGLKTERRAAFQDKLGNYDKASSIRDSLQTSRKLKRENRIGDALEAAYVRQKGDLTTKDMEAKTGLTKSQTKNVDWQTKAGMAKLPGELQEQIANIRLKHTQADSNEWETERSKSMYEAEVEKLLADTGYVTAQTNNANASAAYTQEQTKDLKKFRSGKLTKQELENDQLLAQNLGLDIKNEDDVRKLNLAKAEQQMNEDIAFIEDPAERLKFFKKNAPAIYGLPETDKYLAEMDDNDLKKWENKAQLLKTKGTLALQEGGAAGAIEWLNGADGDPTTKEYELSQNDKGGYDVTFLKPAINKQTGKQEIVPHTYFSGKSLPEVEAFMAQKLSNPGEMVTYMEARDKHDMSMREGESGLMTDIINRDNLTKQGKLIEANTELANATAGLYKSGQKGNSSLTPAQRRTLALIKDRQSFTASKHFQNMPAAEREKRLLEWDVTNKFKVEDAIKLAAMANANKYPGFERVDDDEE